MSALKSHDLEKELIKKILVALDGSGHANHALIFALDLADKYSASILLVSVFHQVYIPGLEPTFTIIESIKESLEAQRELHGKILSEALKKVNKIKPNLRVSTKLMEGRPADKIVEISKEGKFDLIVMGSRGLGGVTKFFLGSVSNRVADQAPCPVLIVR